MRKPLMIARQGGRPSGFLGRIVARIMAKETAAENDVVLELLTLKPDDRVLEIGCGHGETLAKAAKLIPRGSFSGIDFSQVMHRHAMHRHQGLVREGRLQFFLGNSERLPFVDPFDKAYAVHTVYFWTQPLDHLREIRRILKPGGLFVLGFRPAEDERFAATYPSEVYRIRPEAEVVDLVRRAGFDEIEIVARTVGRKRMSFVSAKPAVLTSGARPAVQAAMRTEGLL